MTNITFAQIKTAILTGELDADLDNIKTAMATRREMLQVAFKGGLSVGDKVTFAENCRPVYMRGLKATIIKINRERVVVDLDRPAGRFHKNITCPVSILAV
jgi:hypothetical protein